jgi:hypothetical protein
MHTVTTAPVRPKQSRLTLIRVGPFTAGVNEMVMTVRVEDENGAFVRELEFWSKVSLRQVLAYDASGAVAVADAAVASSGGFLTADFDTWANASGTVAQKCLAMEARLVSTGSFPA